MIGSLMKAVNAIAKEAAGPQVASTAVVKKDDSGADGNFGQNRFADKDEIQEDRNKTMSVEEIGEMFVSAASEGYTRAKMLYRTVRENITPEFMNRISNRKSNQVHIMDTEDKLLQDDRKVLKTITEENKVHLAERKKEKMRQEELARAKAGEDRQRDIIERTKAKQKKDQFDDFHHRRAMQVEEQKVIETRNYK